MERVVVVEADVVLGAVLASMAIRQRWTDKWMSEEDANVSRFVWPMWPRWPVAQRMYWRCTYFPFYSILLAYLPYPPWNNDRQIDIQIDIHTVRQQTHTHTHTDKQTDRGGIGARRMRVFIYSSADYLRTKIFLSTHSYKLFKNDVYYQYLMHTNLPI